MENEAHVGTHSLSKRAAIFQKQKKELEAVKAKRLNQRSEVYNADLLNKMMNMLSTTHYLVQKAEKAARMSVDELDSNIKAHEDLRAAQHTAFLKEQEEALLRTVEGEESTRWTTRHREDETEADFDSDVASDVSDLEFLDKREDIVVMVEEGPSAPPSALPSPAAAAATCPNRLIVEVPPSTLSPSMTNLSITETTLSTTSRKQQRRCGRKSASTVTCGQQTTIFFAPTELEDNRLEVILEMWKEAHKKLRAAEEFVYATNAPLLADMQALVLWVKRTYAELRREFGKSFSLPPVPEMLNAEARNIRERESDRELRFVRRVLQKNELSLMEAEDGDANFKYYRNFADTGCQMKAQTKGIGCQTLVSNDGIGQLARQQHILIEDLLTNVRNSSKYLWAPSFKPNPETSFHTTSHLVDMLKRDVVALQEAVSSVKNTPFSELENASVESRNISTQTASFTEFKMVDKKVETERVVCNDSFVQAQPEFTEAAMNTEMLRKDTLSHFGQREEGADDFSPDAEEKIRELENKLKKANQEIQKKTEEHTKLQLRMDKDRIQKIHESEIDAIKVELDKETKLKDDAVAKSTELKEELKKVQETIVDLEKKFSTDMEQSMKDFVLVKQDSEIKGAKLAEREDEIQRMEKRMESERQKVQQRMQTLDENERRLHALMKQREEELSAQKKMVNQSVTAFPDMEDASTMMPRKFFYDMYAQANPDQEQKGCDPMLLHEMTDSSTMPCPEVVQSANVEVQEGVSFVGAAVEQEEGVPVEVRNASSQVIGLCYCEGKPTKRMDVSKMLRETEPRREERAKEPLPEQGTGHPSPIETAARDAQPMTPVESVKEVDGEEDGQIETTETHSLHTEGEMRENEEQQDEDHLPMSLVPARHPTSCLERSSQVGNGNIQLHQRFTQTFIGTCHAAIGTGQTYQEFGVQIKPPPIEVSGQGVQVVPQTGEQSSQASTAVAQRTRATQSTIAGTCEVSCMTMSSAPEAETHHDQHPPSSSLPSSTVSRKTQGTQAATVGEQVYDEKGDEFEWKPVLPNTAIETQTEQGELKGIGIQCEEEKPKQLMVACQIPEVPQQWSDIEVQTEAPSLPPLPVVPEWIPSSSSSEDREESANNGKEELSPTTLLQDPSSLEKFERLPSTDLDREIPSSFQDKRETVYTGQSTANSNKLNLTLSNPSGLNRARDLLFDTTMSESERNGTAFSVHDMYPSVTVEGEEGQQGPSKLRHSPGVTVTGPTPRKMDRAASLPPSMGSPTRLKLKSLKHKSSGATPQPQLKDSSVLYKFDDSDKNLSKGKSRYSADCFLKSNVKGNVKVNTLAFSDTSVHEAMGSTMKGPSPPVVRGFVSQIAKPRHAPEWSQRKPRFLEPLIPELAEDEDDEVLMEGDRQSQQQEPHLYYSPSKF